LASLSKIEWQAFTTGASFSKKLTEAEEKRKAEEQDDLWWQETDEKAEQRGIHYPRRLYLGPKAPKKEVYDRILGEGSSLQPMYESYFWRSFNTVSPVLLLSFPIIFVTILLPFFSLF
jgi:hypothetical protein